MNMNSQYLIRPFRMDDEEEEEEKEPKEKSPEMGMLMKKLEKYFFETRAIYLWGAVEDKTAKEVTTKMLLLDADKPGEEIKFYINSPGGVVTSGMVIYDTMRMLKSPVSTICMGLAASMGAVLLTAGAHGKRTALKHSRVMMHQPSGAIGGQASDIDITVNEIKKVKKNLYDILAFHTGKTTKVIEKDCDRDYWLTAEESKEYGLVDEVLIMNPRKEKKDL